MRCPRYSRPGEGGFGYRHVDVVGGQGEIRRCRTYTVNGDGPEGAAPWASLAIVARQTPHAPIVPGRIGERAGSIAQRCRNAILLWGAEIAIVVDLDLKCSRPGCCCPT